MAFKIILSVLYPSSLAFTQCFPLPPSPLKLHPPFLLLPHLQYPSPKTLTPLLYSLFYIPGFCSYPGSCIHL